MVVKKQPVRFLAVASGSAIAALYHLAALTMTAVGRFAYSPTNPPWRHIVFIVINFSSYPAPAGSFGSISYSLPKF